MLRASLEVLWSTKSNAFLKSINIDSTMSPLSMHVIHWSINFTKAVWQLCFWRNLDWVSCIRQYLLRYDIKCLLTCLSKILEIVGSMDIGL